ncbi:MAG TPA: hypothetical protein VIC27_00225, partial [Ktedonobacterales bacterium]
MSPLAAWENFYVIVGSSAGALTGLVFVALTLIGDEQRRGASGSIPAFSTPTVAQFGAVLLLAAILSAPWSVLLQLGLLLAAFGLGMLIYTTIIMRRLRHQEIYMPVLEDWLWYGVCPLVAYSGLIVMATLLLSHPAPALFGIAGVMLLLLFNGLHNAWDIVT